MIPAFDEITGGLPPGDHPATLTEIERQLGFTPRRRWLLKSLRVAMTAFWAAGIKDVFIDGSFCTSRPDPDDIDGYWVEPDPGVYDRIDPYWIDYTLIFIPHMMKRRCRMWAEFGVEFFIHPALVAPSGAGFPEFFRQDRNGRPRGIVRVVKSRPRTARSKDTDTA